MDIFDKPVINKEISEVVNSLKNKKTVGSNAIINEMIKTCVPFLTRVFVKVISHLFICEELLETWTKSFISALYDKRGMFNPNNHQGLTISNSLGKVVTKITTGDLSRVFRVKVLLQMGTLALNLSNELHTISLSLIRYVMSINVNIKLCICVLLI